MTIRIVYTNGKQLGRQFRFGVERFGERSAKAAQAAAKKAADEILRRGRANMRAAGDFDSARWQNGLQARISFTSRTDIRIRVTHSVFYWVVFEEGRVIRGKPLLWIPLDFAKDAQGVRAKDYPGRLFRVDRRVGAPLLLAAGGKPKYFGKEFVRIPKKFRLREIAASEASKLPTYYKRAMRNG